MTTTVPCTLCRPPADPAESWAPREAAPGWLACHACADRLSAALGDLADRYTTLQTADELIPHGSDGRGSPGFGPRSPAVDALLVHSDTRTRWTSELGYGTLAVVEQWARLVREETGAAAPLGRVTFEREMRTIRFHWPHVLAAAWLPDFAGEVHAAGRALTMAGRLTERVMRVGPCPTVQTEAFVDEYGYSIAPTMCGTTLRVRADADEIRCRSCGSVWPRSRWHELGDTWADYAVLADDLGVPVGTLRRWAHEDGWAREVRGRRHLVSRQDALASAARRGKAVA